MAVLLVSGAAHAGFESFAIEQVYSNADGTVQFVVLREMQGLAGGHAWTGRTFEATRPGVAKSYTFPRNLPDNATAGRRVLLGSEGMAALGLVAPDYVLPDGFVPTDGATLDFAGADQVTYASLPTDGVNAITRLGFPTPNAATNYAGLTAPMPARPVTAIEFRHAALDHYFVSNLQPDLDALDSGRTPGWTRTGLSFKVHPSAVSGGGSVSPVCRWYLPPARGDSHFFSASPAECAAIAQKMLTDPWYSGYVLETAQAFFVALPDAATGACPAGTTPVYRLWNQRMDSNHRYTADAAAKAQMIAQGHVAEGYGPDAVAMCAPPGTATVRVSAGAASPFGVLVSDAASTAATSHLGFTMPGDSVDVGTRSGSGEAVAFGVDRPPTVRPVTWATRLADQLVIVPFAPLPEIPVTIWVVAGPWATTQQAALTFWQTAQLYFGNERLGVRMSALEIVDATANPNASAWAAFTCGNANANVAALQGAIGARAGRINVYVVGLVDGSTSRGNVCTVGGGFAAIAAGAGAELLAHELMHDLALEHVDDLSADFDATNIMHSASNVRRYLTEGQTFRAHLRSNSALNSVYGQRSGLPLRDCDRDTPALGCPPVARRLWADGAYAPD
ncbi:MAG: hypothetical protein IT517_04820 [Burkholderiales bacterium]|nr:hypothetical protein [Burkholderiales bacterium]